MEEKKNLVHGGEKEWRGKMRKIYEEGKYLVHGGDRTEREREENIWTRKIFGPRTEKERTRKILRGGKYLVRGGDEEWRRKRRKLFGRGKLIVTSTDLPTGWILDIVQSAFSNVRQ